MSEQNKKILHESAAEYFSEKRCESEARLLRFIEGTTSANETREIQAHLNECEHCAYIVGAAYDYEAHPITEAELQEARKLVMRTPEEEAERLLGPSPKLDEVIDEAPTPSSSLLERLRAFLPEVRFARPIVWGPAFSVALVILTLGGRWGWRYAQTDYKIGLAAKLLKQEYTVFIKDARLSGGYGSSGISELMGPEEEEEKYSARAAKLATQAIQNGAESVQAKQLLAQSFFIEKKYERVDSLIRELTPMASSSAALLNDLGVYHFQKDDWAEAEKYFSAAIARDAKFLEARYNLALTKAEVGAREEAVRIMQEYLALETDENWRIAAEDFVKSN